MLHTGRNNSAFAANVLNIALVALCNNRQICIAGEAPCHFRRKKPIIFSMAKPSSIDFIIHLFRIGFDMYQQVNGRRFNVPRFAYKRLFCNQANGIGPVSIEVWSLLLYKCFS